MSLTPLNVSHQLRYPEIIGQGLTGNFQFGQSAVVVAVSLVRVLGRRLMRFTRIGTKPSRGVDGSLGGGQTRGCRIVANEINVVVSGGELAIGIEKRWVMRNSLVQ